MADREKAEDVFSNLLDEKQLFFRDITTSKQKCENWRKHFSRHRKTRQNAGRTCLMFVISHRMKPVDGLS